MGLFALDVAILSFCSSLLPMKAKKPEGLKASQDNTRAKVAPSERVSGVLDRLWKLGSNQVK
jgi:hypothetical protein